ncbi:MAG: L-lysine 6-transaminase [Thermoanaerobaculia bacterium]
MVSIHERLAQHILADGLPFVMDLDRSHGPYLVDQSSGREILDLFMSFATNPLGYNHPGLRKPEFVERILPSALNKPSNSDFYTEYMADFVDALARTVPSSLAERMFFISGGALAVENALKTAFDWKVRKNLAAGRSALGHRIIHLREAFHGRSGYTMSMTNTDPRKTDYFPQFEWPRITNPKLRFPVTESVVEAVEEAERHSIDEIKQALVDHPDDIAGLILEPIQGEGGDHHFRAEYFQALRDLADEAEFLLIYDEVQTGFGTTGKWWCFEHFGVEPDVFAFGKKTQVCGVCANQRIDEVDSVFKVSSRINSTWGGNLVDMVRCQRFIEIIEEDGLLANAESVSRHFLQSLGTLAEAQPELVSNVRGRGMFLAFDLPTHETRERLLKSMIENDLLGLRSGSEAIRFRPPLNLTLAEVDEALRRLGRALDDLA